MRPEAIPASSGLPNAGPALICDRGNALKHVPPAMIQLIMVGYMSARISWRSSSCMVRISSIVIVPSRYSACRR